ncbi:MAG: radical SAM protein [Candidatus Gastranaerophilales bacterium]|nr:radical SAM protein [Candidatus Gastranaerophilales bacterium]
MSEYISCDWIEGGMDFDVGVFGSNIMMCCYVSCPGGGNIMLKRGFDGSPIDWDEFWRLKKHYKDIQKSGETIKECTDCVFLRKDKWRDKNYIDSIIFDHFTKCNCDCVYCYTHEDKKKYNSVQGYNVLPVIKDMVERGIFIPGGQIGFGGGEPTMLEEFEDLIHYLLDNGFDNISIPTSAVKYSPVIEKGVSQGKIHVKNSIDSGCRETFAMIKGLDAFDTVVKNMKRYASVKIDDCDVISKYIICPGYNDRKSEIDKWLDTCKKIGIEYAEVSVENIWLRNHRHEGNEEVIELVKYILDKGGSMFNICKGENHVMQLLAGVKE